MFCSKCGEKLKEDDKFCGKCGSSVGPAKKTVTKTTVVAEPAVVVASPDVVTLPSAYKPISPIGYVGYIVLFALPCIGQIMVIILACGVSDNKNVTNFARGYLITWAIGFIVAFVFYFLAFLLYAAM